MQKYEELEQNLTSWCGLPTAVCATGTAALQLALEALKMPPGSKVIVPDYTFVACARAVTMAGLVPVFVDVKADDLLIDPKLIRQAVEKYSPIQRSDISAIMAVHSYGRRCDMDAIHAIANEHDLFVIEDLAQGHGIPVHRDTDAACWSFYRNKIICGEEGGAVASRLPDVIERVKCLRSQGYRPGEFWNHEPRGINARMTNAQAELIDDSLMKRGYNRGWRSATREMYDELCPDAWKMPHRNVVWLYDFRVKGLPSETQRQLIEELNKAGIYARPGFRPLSSMDEYKYGTGPEVPFDRVNLTTEAEWGWREVIGLECSPGITTRETVRRAWDIIRRVITT